MGGGAVASDDLWFSASQPGESTAVIDATGAPAAAAGVRAAATGTRATRAATVAAGATALDLAAARDPVSIAMSGDEAPSDDAAEKARALVAGSSSTETVAAASSRGGGISSTDTDAHDAQEPVPIGISSMPAAPAPFATSAAAAADGATEGASGRDDGSSPGSQGTFRWRSAAFVFAFSPFPPSLLSFL